MIAAGTRAYVETSLETLSGVIAFDVYDVEGAVFVLLDDEFAHVPGQIVRLDGRQFETVRGDSLVFKA